MAYVSLYRKYRSQTFNEVMGQEHVTKTLQNAIKSGKVAHAYLFCGTRGTGKTTTARLLAKAMNCVSSDGPTITPCNQCPACKSITEGSAMDIIELDAASHRSIRDVEEIRENVKFPPMDLRYKVFIIDEAHQLSGDAKDAFLKTLEEPPAHTIFVLATTEPQNIPITIRSRCQQFDFRRGSLKDIKDRLKYVADSEGVKVDDAALDLMAVNADGSYRDSLSLMEQVFAYTDGHVAADDVNTVLGTVTQEFIICLVDTLADGSESGAFDGAAEVVESGRDIQQILKSISQHFRNLLFASVTKNLGDVVTSEQAAARLVQQSSRFSKQSLLKAVEIFTEAERDVRYTDQHRLILELALLKVIQFIHQPAPTVQTIAPPVDTVPVFSPPKTVEPPVKREPSQPKRDSVPITPAKPEIDTPAAPAPASLEQKNLPEFDKIEAKWGQVLQHLKTISNPAYALLTSARPLEIRNGSLVLAFEGEGQKNILMNEAPRGKSVTKKQALLMAIQRVFGVADAGIICEVGEISPKQPAPASDQTPQVNNEPVDLFKDNGHDTLRDVLDIFNGEIVDE
ncbi:MAG: DNA polymerase III subunit gamma/tau [Armatimonadota bacterium]